DSAAESGTDPGAEPGDGDGQPQQGPGRRAGTGMLDSVLHDGVTDGALIAKIPTARLVRSLLRDLGFLVGTIMSVVGVCVAISLALWQDGFSVGVIIALLPTAITIPKYIFGRIESGWGFVSRHTE